MYILGFETTGPVGSVAIIDLDKCSEDGSPMCSDAIKMKVTTEPMSHLKNTAELARELLSEYGIDVGDDVAAVASSIGPGSFTGIRIGVTIARAIAQSLDIPAIAVPTLEVFRERCSGPWLIDANGDARKERGSVVAGILNARRGQVYGAVYQCAETQDKVTRTLLAPGPYMLTDILEITDKYPEAIFFGDGVDAYQDILLGEKDNADSRGFDASNQDTNKSRPVRILAPEEVRYQTADLVVKIAARKYFRSELLTASELLPDYMRLAEAEQKLNDGTLAKLREAKLARMRHG